MELNYLKEESKKNSQLILGQKSKLSQIVDMLEKITANQTDSPSQSLSVISSKKRFYSDLLWSGGDWKGKLGWDG